MTVENVRFNPLIATEQIQKDYINFFKTSFTLENLELSQQLDKLSRENLLWKSPFIVLSQNYQLGSTRKDLVEQTRIFPEILDAIGIKQFYLHQELAIKNIVSNKKIEKTGVKPKYSLDDGINELIKFYKTIKHWPLANI